MNLVKSSSYEQHMLSHLHTLYERGYLTDLSLKIEDREFCVHKAVLTACSSYFYGLLLTGNLEEPVFTFQGLAAETMEVLIDFMYTGLLNILPTNSFSLLEAAKYLNMPMVITIVEEYIDINTPEKVTKSYHNLPLLPNTHINQYSTKLENFSSHLPSTHVPTTEDLRTHSICSTLSKDINETEYSHETNMSSQVDKMSNCSSRIKKSSRLTSASSVNNRNYFEVCNQIAQNKQDQIKDLLTAIKTEDNLEQQQSYRNETPGLKAKINKIRKNSYRNGVIILKPDQSKYQCNLCKKKFYFKCSLVLHKSVFHSKQVRRFRSIYRGYFLAKRMQTFSNAKIANTNYQIRKRGAKTALKNLRSVNITKRVTRSSLSTKETPGEIEKKLPFICIVCKCKFMSLKNFHKHWLMLHKRKQHALHIHVKQKHEKFQFHKKTYKNKFALKKDFAALDKKRKVHKCGICPKKNCQTFLFKKNLLHHLHTQHEWSEKSYKSNEKFSWNRSESCGFQTKMKALAGNHMKISHPNVSFQCSHCKFKSRLQEDLRRHQQKPHNIACDICQEKFRSIKVFQLHKYNCHDSQRIPKEEKYTFLKICAIDGCTFAHYNQSELKTHQLEHHDCTCKECGKKLKTPMTLEKHIIAIHQGIKPYICEFCGMSYTLESQLKIHINRHNEVKNFHCQMCDYATHDRGNLKSHLFSRHGIKISENMKTFKCNVCEFVTDMKYRYSEHMKVHLNVRDLKCSECDKTFITRKTLRGHIVKVHKPKNLHCEYCSYATAEVTKLKDHMRILHTHRDFKPYKCVYCSFRSATGGNCRKHVMLKHRGMEVKVEKLKLELPPAQDPVTINANVQKTSKKKRQSGLDMLSANNKQSFETTGDWDLQPNEELKPNLNNRLDTITETMIIQDLSTKSLLDSGSTYLIQQETHPNNLNMIEPITQTTAEILIPMNFLLQPDVKNKKVKTHVKPEDMKYRSRFVKIASKPNTNQAKNAHFSLQKSEKTQDFIGQLQTIASSGGTDLTSTTQNLKSSLSTLEEFTTIDNTSILPSHINSEGI